MVSQEPSVWTRLDLLEPFFSVLEDAPEEDRALLRPVLDIRPELRREERRIVVFGAFKAGKSTLLNALIGVPVLPARAQRTAGAVVSIRHGPAPQAELVRRDAAPEAIAFGDAAGAILAGGEVDEVRIAVPHPMLAGGGVLVDTPGLLDEEQLTERSRRELERADLAVMVLSADKILSSQERMLAAWVNELLHGNIAFAVNRLDLVEEDDREELLEWAGAALRETGNELVGRPRVFATAARESAVGIAELSGWLADLLSGERGERVAVLSRLSVLALRLAEAADRIRGRLAEAREHTRETQQAALEQQARERVAIKREIAQGRRRLEAARANLATAGEAFVSDCVEDTRRTLRPGARGAVLLELDGAAEDYAEAVTEEFVAALDGLPLTVPTFDLQSWIFRGQVDPAKHPFTETWTKAGDIVGTVLEREETGREAGATIGGWIGKNVFGVDPGRETIKRIEGGARAALESLETEVDAYVARLGELLDQVDRYHDSWSRPSPAVTAAEEAELRWSHLFHWCEGFQHAVSSAIREIAGG